jgi:hypothetical protein
MSDHCSCAWCVCLAARACAIAYAPSLASCMLDRCSCAWCVCFSAHTCPVAMHLAWVVACLIAATCLLARGVSVLQHACAIACAPSLGCCMLNRCYVRACAWCVSCEARACAIARVPSLGSCMLDRCYAHACAWCVCFAARVCANARALAYGLAFFITATCAPGRGVCALQHTRVLCAVARAPSLESCLLNHCYARACAWCVWVAARACANARAPAWDPAHLITATRACAWCVCLVARTCAVARVPSLGYCLLNHCYARACGWCVSCVACVCAVVRAPSLGFCIPDHCYMRFCTWCVSCEARACAVARVPSLGLACLFTVTRTCARGESVVGHAHVLLRVRLAWGLACLITALACGVSALRHARLTMRADLAYGLACWITATRVLARGVSAERHARVP